GRVRQYISPKSPRRHGLGIPGGGADCEGRIHPYSVSRQGYNTRSGSLLGVRSRISPSPFRSCRFIAVGKTGGKSWESGSLAVGESGVSRSRHGSHQHANPRIAARIDSWPNQLRRKSRTPWTLGLKTPKTPPDGPPCFSLTTLSCEL